MAFTTIPLAAGVARDESDLAAKPLYINADKVRAVAGKMETIYGQELAASSAPTAGPISCAPHGPPLVHICGYR